MLLDKFTKYSYPLFGWVKMPNVTIALEDKTKIGLSASCSNYDFLRTLINEGLKKKPPQDKDKAIERIKYELGVLKKLGFIDYILLIWQLTNFADSQRIARGRGRGSAAGCYILFLIDATKVNSLKHGLIFERFINEARAKSKIVDGQLYVDGKMAPDIDSDFATKEPVVAYLNRTYPNKVCKIINLASLTGKNLVKETLKVVETANEDDARKAADIVPKKFGVVADIYDAYYGEYSQDGTLKNEPIPEFVNWANEHPKTFRIACLLNYLYKNTSIHASGYIVSADELKTFLPCQIATSEDGERDVAGVFTMDWIAKLAVKVDILKVRCCAVIQDVCNETGTDIDTLNLENDPDIYDQLRNGVRAMKGIFQVEAHCVGGVVDAVKPPAIDGLCDCIAIGRPGALASLSDYIKGDKECPHPLFKNILGPTRNLCLYQETIMQLLVAVGFSLIESDECRRIIGKKKREEVIAWESKIYDRCKENGFDKSIGDMLWKILLESSDYSFNRSHSFAYAEMAAITLKLKKCFPLNFYKSLLNHAKEEPKPFEEISEINREMRMMEIPIYPPDFSSSSLDFEIEGSGIRFGLASIKGLKEGARKLADLKKPENKFELFANAKEIGLKVNNISALIMSGAMNSLSYGSSRAFNTLQAQLWSILTDKEKKLSFDYGEQFDYNLIQVVSHLNKTKDGKGKEYIKDSRLQTISKKFAKNKEMFELNKKYPEITEFFYENMLLGISYSHELSAIFKNYYDKLISIEDVNNADEGNRVEFVGIVKEPVKNKKSKAGNQYGEWILRDEGGEIRVMVFNSSYENKLDDIRAKHGGKLPSEDRILYVSGTKKGNAVFASNVVDQTVKIYTKFSMLKDKDEVTEDNNF